MAASGLTTYMTIGDIARHAHVTPEAARQWVESGQIPVRAQTAAGRRLFLVGEVEAFLTQRARYGGRRKPVVVVGEE